MPSYILKPYSIFNDRSMAVLFYGSFLLFVFRGCLFQTDLSVPSSLVVTCWEKVLAPLFVMFTCVFVTFIFGGLGQVW